MRNMQDGNRTMRREARKGYRRNLQKAGARLFCGTLAAVMAFGGIPQNAMAAVTGPGAYVTAGPAGGQGTGTLTGSAAFSAAWYQGGAGEWRIRGKDGADVKDRWICDDAVAANGKDVWYLIDASGQMISAPLVRDRTGNYYSLETEHNGYFGMLRFRDGEYGGIRLEFEKEHNGSFGAIRNADGLAALMAKYGVTDFAIDNANITYTSEICGSSGPRAGGGSGGSGGSGGGGGSRSGGGGGGGSSSGGSSSSGTGPSVSVSVTATCPSGMPSGTHSTVPVPAAQSLLTVATSPFS